MEGASDACPVDDASVPEMRTEMRAMRIQDCHCTSNLAINNEILSAQAGRENPAAIQVR